MKKLPVSVCMISGAEAHQIGKALASVAGWVEEIVVVLNEEAADGTEEIARSHDARIFREPWRGHIAQRNSVAAKATQPWLLMLDADEEVSPALRNELESLFADEKRLGAHSVYGIPRCTFYAGRWIRHGDWYPDVCLRLCRREGAKWGGANPHDKLIVTGPVGRLKNDLLHFSYRDLDHHVAKSVSYSNDFARGYAAQGRRVRYFQLWLHPFWRFFRAYFLRRGFLDGWQGYAIAWMTAFYTFLRYAKVYQAQAKSNR